MERHGERAGIVDADYGWKFGENRDGRWFDHIYDKAKRAVIYLYLEAAKQPDFVHRNWMRSELTVKSFEDFILRGPVDPVKRLSDRD